MSVDSKQPKAEVQTVVNGPLEENCYIVSLPQSNNVMVVDPGYDIDLILEAIGDRTVDLILATHYHWDHVGAVGPLKDATGAPFWIGEKDAPHIHVNPSEGSGSDLNLPERPNPDHVLKDGETFEVAGLKMTVMEVPGHTPGGIVVYGNGIALTGDTLFKGTAGRTDFPGGDAQAMRDSLVRIGTELDPNLIVYPGHFGSSTVEHEVKTNPFLVRYLRLNRRNAQNK